MKAVLYSYEAPLSNDAEGKLRPGFRVNDTVFCLTHTRPFLTGFVEIQTAHIESEHFKPKSQIAYLTYATSPTKKYNNNAGGILNLSPEVLAFIKLIEPACEEYLLINETSQPNEAGD